MPNLRTITVTDSGDGSTTLRLEYEDGTTDYLNEDIPYDGHIKFNFVNGKHDSTTVDYD